MAIHVIATDTDTGEQVADLTLGDGPNGYIVLCGEGCDVAHVAQYPKAGTTVVTIKRSEG